MIIPYRTQCALKRTAVILLVLLVVAALALVCWFLWLDRFVVYTRDNGATLRFDLPHTFSPGIAATAPVPEETVSIYYNEGDNAIQTDTELMQLAGYYVDKAALEKDLSAVRAQIQALPAGTPVMVDVKSIYGSFFYSSNVSDRYSSNPDPAAMDELISYMNSRGLYIIAYLPAFRDYYYGLHHVSDGLPVKSGGYLWADENYCYWLDPTSQGTMTFLIQIINELRSLGFDEVVFYDFRFPDTNKILFDGDKAEALATAAKTLVSTCATDRFAVSFASTNANFALPEGRSRLYLLDVAAANADSVAQQTGLADPAVNLVFLTNVHDTRFDVYGVLRPLSSAH